ncbi:UDP-2,4-diacetamido-2,4,6-trideoxy-beta-L-altropyranose hydrolase [Adhaeribacter pallidiroseus]|uniref:N-acetyltransferase domain-containing protein n=1 Tax=Adhaeribacter pallidiroseus TaxID=2072847 RepID=A0A369QAS0_9BACT|nr:UDP-2,4-diacetamido-2,4,6-trideoxy-beta-L-altropyranose hydrolase [Adhaeribacter pallidiroseus]RDC62011.1 hypothetical protein AHMF7616_00601 [Adhaeribacter pallidiroseus]
MQILFRADGNSTIGLGHLVRTLALAEMLHPFYTCSWAIQEPSEAISQQIKQSGCTLIKLPATTDYVAEAKYLTETYAHQFSAVILDGYLFTTDYQQILRPFFKIICIDDLHTGHFVANTVINPAGGISPDNYSKEAYTKIYAGPEYALLRPPFLEAATAIRTLPAISRVFMNMGGADPENFTAQVLENLAQLPGEIKIEVVVGSAYRHRSSLAKWADRNTNVTIHQQLSAAQMCQLMQACSLAILPPSTVAYEWCSVGGPLYFIQTAENQENLKNFLLQEQLALPFDELNNLLPETRLSATYFAEQLHKQRQFFDGQSPARLCQVVDQLFYRDLLHLRRTNSGDLQLLFHWINDPVVRRFSLNPETVPLTTHTTWFRYKLTDKNCFIFIAEIRQVPVGMIRFDIHQRETIISYLVDENYRGKGLGTLLLQEGILKFKIEAHQVSSISGLVQKENIASIKAFTKAGFTINPEGDKDYPNVLKFTLLN